MLRVGADDTERRAALGYLLSVVDGFDGRDRLGPEVAPAVLPLVVALGQDHAHQADEARAGGERLRTREAQHVTD